MPNIGEELTRIEEWLIKALEFEGHTLTEKDKIAIRIAIHNAAVETAAHLL